MEVPSENNYDVLLIGAGISGVNHAYRLQERHPELSYAILEGREESGGTWAFFKYPGLRSDSDLYTFGFSWRAWTTQSSIAEGDLIKEYVRESAAMYGIDKKMLFRHMVEDADWSSEEQAWYLNVTVGGEKKATFRSRFIIFCTGYYDYKEPLKAEIPGISNFKGPVVHPQFWPEDLDYSNKNIVIIGSGATSVTLLPALAKTASHVTMLQRSPSYLLSQPSEDGLEKLIRRFAPLTWQNQMLRLKWITTGYMIVRLCRWFPNAMINFFRKATIAQLPPEIKHDPHFKPTYTPFEQRVCFCPDGDYYKALRKGKSSVVTGIIESVTPDSIKLKDGQELHPDIIITATGLKMQLAGGMSISVDGVPINLGEKYMWKNLMFQDVPNAAYTIGYVDASWTLGADAAAQLFGRIVSKMQKEGASVIVPRIEKGKEPKQLPLMGLTSTYVEKAKDLLPRAGDHPQWRGRSSYFHDIWQSWYGDIVTGVKYLKGAEASSQITAKA